MGSRSHYPRDGSEEPGHLYWSGIELAWDIVDIYSGPEVFLNSLRKVTPGQGAVLAVHWCQSEVCNGGFTQFFSNSTGILAPEASCGFSLIGMPEYTQLVDTAISLFGDEYPRDREKRCCQLKELCQAAKERTVPTPFTSLNKEFYALLGRPGQSLEAAMDKYVRMNRQDFFVD